MKPPVIATETGQVAASMLAGWGLDWADTIAAIEAEARASAGDLTELRKAAQAVLDCGVGNLNGDKYRRRVEAFDALDDALNQNAMDADR